MEKIKKLFSYNFSELKLDFYSFLDFLKKNKLTVILCWFFLLFSYGIKLFYYSISIDTEIALLDIESMLYWWYGINRCGLVFIKKLLGLVPLNPFVANFLMLLTAFLFLIFLSFIFYSLSLKFNFKPKGVFILPCVFIAQPLFAEQFNFTLQTFEISFAFLLMFLSVYLVTKWVFDQKLSLYLILSVLLLAWSFSCYQAVVFLYITVALSVFIFIYINNSKNSKNNVEKNFFRIFAIKYLLTFFFSFLLCNLVNFLIQQLFHIKVDYVNNMVMWNKEPFFKCLKGVLSYIKQTILGDGLFYSKFFLIILLMTSFVFFKFLFFKGRNNKNKILYSLAFFTFIGSPYFLAVFLGRPLIPRMQFSYQFVMAFVLFIFVNNFLNSYILKRLIVFFSLYFSLFFGYRAANMFYTDYMKYQSEVELANKISSRIENLDLKDINNTPVAIVGGYAHVPNTPVAINGEFINLSFFIDRGRSMSFMKTIGYFYKYATDEEFLLAKKIAENMKVWPSPESVRYEQGIVVVKLS